MMDIGGKLDTIARLLAGAPPAPEEKFMFQKYVYCKMDHTSWVESLLSELGISYTQVGSLINGLYEYRCECTNDAFNQVILSVELSTYPVLATYKKIDSFSDLVGINVFDMGQYSAGCDARISKSTIITPAAIKYWGTIQMGLIVQRQLDLAGSASIGKYSIDFSGGDVISGSVPINGTIRDNILYRKVLSGSGLDYALTNCTIEGWIIDLKKRTGDISDDYVVAAGGASAPNAYDDDMSSFAGQYVINGGTLIAWQVDLPEPRHITSWNIFEYWKINGASPGTGYIYHQVFNTDTSAWETLKLHSTTTATIEGTTGTHVVCDKNISALRTVFSTSSAHTMYCKIYDISVFD